MYGIGGNGRSDLIEWLLKDSKPEYLLNGLKGIKISNANIALDVGKKATLIVKPEPAEIDISKKTIKWTSSNTSVATVNQKGLVTAVGNGKATITASLDILEESGMVSTIIATCIVWVPGMPETGGLGSEKPKINLSETQITIPIQQVKKINITSDESLDNKIIKWHSSNEAVATVNENGLIMAIGEGNTDIIVTVGKQNTEGDAEFTSETCSVVVSGQLGDVDNDKSITAYDAYKALEASVNLLIGIDVDEQVILTSDVDRDENITAQDAYKILQYSVGEIDEF